MRQVELSDALFARLQRLAEPLVDSVETVIERAVDAYEQGLSAHTNASGGSVQSTVQPKQFSGDFPPDLKHTKVLSVRLNGRVLREANWNGLLVETIRLAKTSGIAADELRRLVPVNFVAGKKQDEGYRFYPDIDLSVQGRDANSAWSAACEIARQLGISIEVGFRWRAKDGAALPGMAGRLTRGEISGHHSEPLPTEVDDTAAFRTGVKPTRTRIRPGPGSLTEIG